MFTQPYDDTLIGIKSTFAVTLEQDYLTYAQILQNSSADEIFGTGGNKAVDPNITEIINTAGQADGAEPVYFTRGKCRDTSLGGNDAINPYYQFCENDDVPHPFTLINQGDFESGMGRVYSESIDDNQQIMWITFGVPYFNDVTDFYGGAVIDDLAKLMNGGANSSVHNITKLLGSAVTTFLLLPALPIVYLAGIINGIGSIGNIPITKYYEFKPDMPVYYRCVNSMMIHLAINMGMGNDAYAVTPQGGTAAPLPIGTPINQSSSSSDASLAEAYLNNASSGAANVSGLPEVFSLYGFDIFRINAKRAWYQSTKQNVQNTSNGQTPFIDSVITENLSMPAPEGGNFFTQFWSNFKTDLIANLYDANLYIGFRVENSTDTSESISNKVDESSVAQSINSKSAEAREAGVSVMQGNLAGGIIGSIISGATGLIKGAANAISGATGTKSELDIFTGQAYIDIPNVYKNSSFHKSHNFEFKLRTPYGDPVSIMQSIYVPLCLLLAGALPKGTGPSSYTAPFICRAYSKGLFAVPLGMITNMTIKRGADQFGWNHQMLPTQVNVSFEIEDLSPTMFLVMADQNPSIMAAFGANTSFQEYLMTLGGMGLMERLRFTLNLRRKAKILSTSIYETKLTPYGMASMASSSTVGRVISSILPSSLLPTN
jgi:hypothetical protein